MTKKYVIVVAGGAGSRMGSEIPKQFLLLGDKPVLMHTINLFVNYDPDIDVIVVLPKEQESLWMSFCEKYNFRRSFRIAHGGTTRFHSVQNGLALITEPGVVAIHDGVRPFVSIDTIKRVFHKAELFGAAIPIRDMDESLRFADAETNYGVNRNNLKIVQTPQAFRSDIVISAYNKAYHEDFTDDATVVERNGVKIVLVEGNRENIKLTTPFDFKIGEVLVRGE